MDGGGFFPENDAPEYRDVASFLMDGMKLLGTDAVGAGEKELRYGYSFLKANIERSGLPVVCSNMFIKKTGKPVRNSMTSPYLWLLCMCAVVPAMMFWDNTAVLAGFIALFCVGYTLLYWRIVRFRAPRWMVIRPRRAKAARQG